MPTIDPKPEDWRVMRGDAVPAVRATGTPPDSAWRDDGYPVREEVNLESLIQAAAAALEARDGIRKEGGNAETLEVWTRIAERDKYRLGKALARAGYVDLDVEPALRTTRLLAAVDRTLAETRE